MAFYVQPKENEEVNLQFGFPSNKKNNAEKKIVTKIELLYDSHRGNYFNAADTHPLQLLDKSKKLYCSSKCSSFKKKENDWIIFKFTQFTPIPTKMEIKNGSCKSAVKIMRMYIGNKNNNEWYELINGDKCQSFDIINTIKFDDLQHIKLELIENYGEKWDIGAKYCFVYPVYHIILFIILGPLQPPSPPSEYSNTMFRSQY
eukprot:303917_1